MMGMDKLGTDGLGTDGLMGEPLTVAQAIDNLISPDTGLRFYAAWWLGRFKVTDGLAVVRLVAALQDEDDRTPEGGYPMRRNAARALGKIGDRRAVLPLIDCLDCADFYVREAAAQALAMLGDVALRAPGGHRAVPKLVERLRIGLAGDGLKSGADLVEPFDSILEALGTLGATGAMDLIVPFLGHPVGRTQYAADRAMYQLTGDAQYGNLLIAALRGNDLQLRRAALTDVGAIGYLPAAEAIAETLAENSLKLIALKGLLEKQVAEKQIIHQNQLTEGAIRVMDLMDGLL
jgi:phycocyanobilin lyase subunit alpha